MLGKTKQNSNKKDDLVNGPGCSTAVGSLWGGGARGGMDSKGFIFLILKNFMIIEKLFQ